MSEIVDRLLAQLDARGLSVHPGREPGRLILRGPDAEKTPDLMQALAAFKPLLLERFSGARPDGPPSRPATPEPEPEPEPWQCVVCRGWVYVSEADWRGVGGALCPVEGEWRASPDGGPVEVAPRCPYKPGGSRG